MTELYDQCRRKLLESAHSTVKSELLQHTRDFSFTKTCKTWKITVIGILCFTVIAKIFSLLHPTALLLEPDPVFGIPIKYMVFAASVTEILLVVFLWCARDLSNSAWAVIWFSLAIIGYRILAHSSGHSYCPCLGDVADWWPWLGQHENQVLMTTAIWLLLTSLAVLLSLRVEPVYLEGLKRTIAAAHLESPMIGMALAVLGLLVVLVTCVPLYIPFNGGADEGIELSKMLLLYRRPDLALLASGSQPWFYSHIFASVFSVTGFEPWIPRAVNIAFLGVLLLTLSRFMPAGAERWHWVGGCIFFLTWPSVFYLSVSARPDLAALALAVLAVAVLPQSRKEWRMWRFALSGLLLALAAQLRVASLMVITAGAISLILVNKKETRDEAGDAEISSLFRQQFWLGLFFASIFFVISFALFSAWHPSTDWRSLFSSFRMTALAPQAASYRFASRDLLRSPATMAAVLVGISLLSHRRLLGNAASVLTFLATVVVVSIGVRPWWYYDMVYFSIPMAILAGWGTVELLRTSWKSSTLKSQLPIVASGSSWMAGFVVIALWFANEFAVTRGEIAYLQQTSLTRTAAVQILHQYGIRTKWVYTRDNALAAFAGCMLPPEITSLPPERFWSGATTSDTVLKVVQKYKCGVLVLGSRPEMAKSNWVQFVTSDYVNVWSDGTETIWVANSLNPGPTLSPKEFLNQVGL